MGLIYGAGVGTVLGLALAGPPGLATWVVMGAGVGVVIGSVAELWRDVERRSAH
jgi:outer membrane lipoprotein SlyB